MTDSHRGMGGGTAGPPWPLDVLADLHARALDEAAAARLWPRVQADPEAMAVIAALEATSADLGALRDAPAPPIPATVAARIDTALAAEDGHASDGPAAPVTDLAAARRRRNRRLGWGAGLLAAAAALVAAVVIAVPTGTTGGTPMAEQTQGNGGAPLALRGDNMGAGLGKALGVRDYGPLENRARLDECREAAGLDPDVRPVGVRPVTIDGHPAVLVVLTTGEFARYRLVAFAPDCGPGTPGVLKDTTVGGTTR